MKLVVAAFVFVGVVAAPLVARAATINVAPGDGYAKIEAAKPGDEVVMAPGKYAFRVHLTQKATPQAPLVIRAQDPKNPPVVDFGSTLVENAPGSYTAGDRGRGCWQLAGATNVELSGIVFQNCKNAANNSAGIRYYAGASVRIKDCVFRQNDNGLTGGTGDSTAVVEWSEFDGNGNLQASAPTHNIYVYGGTFTLRYSYLHDPIQGQNFHVRAHDSTIEYNWFARAKSYSGDLMTNDDCTSAPCAHAMLVRGNLFLVGTPANTSQIIAVFNDNGITGATMNVRVVWNTFVVTAANAHAVHLANADGTKMTAEVSNNVISGGNTPVLIDDAGKGTATGTNNWLPTGTPVGTLTGTVFGANPFKNAAGKDFTLAAGPAIGGANGGVTGAPDKEYFQNETIARAYRVRASVKDIGAFESTTTGTGIGPYGTPPTPTTDAGVPPGSDGGTPPPGSDGGTPPPGSDGGVDPTDPESGGGCGCAVAGGPTTNGVAGVAGLIGLALAALVRLRARRRR
jgi:MYXO-CTERM domain-containing protein